MTTATVGETYIYFKQSDLRNGTHLRVVGSTTSHVQFEKRKGTRGRYSKQIYWMRKDRWDHYVVPQ